MAVCSFENFDITVRGRYAPYGVTASFGGMLAEGEFAEDVHHPDWQQLRHSLAETIHTPSQEIIRAAGARLFHSLMVDDIREIWLRARQKIENDPKPGLRIRLALQPPPVAALPWEALFDPDRNIAFGALSHTPLLRVENLLRQIGPPRPLRAQLPVKVLLVAPDDPTGQIDTEHEIEHIQSLLDAVGREAICTTLLAGQVSVTDLRRKLVKETPDLLHIISHGQPDGILFWRRNRPALVTAAALRTALAHAPSVKLVFLNACLAGLDSERQSFTSVGTQILQTGVPAVIAMQFPIRDDAAIDFAYFLYEELLRGQCPGAIDYAMASARSHLFSLGPGDISFATPILWQNTPSGMVFQVTGQGDPVDASPESADEQIKPALDDLDIPAEQAWLVDMDATIALDKLAREVRFLAREWRRTVDALHRLLDQIAAIVKNRNAYKFNDKYVEYQTEKAVLLRLRAKIHELSA